MFLAERNPMTGHYNEDRGSFVLEAGGRTILCDPGTTNYANPACAFMDKRAYHNTVYPLGMPMQICNLIARQSADEAGIGCTIVLKPEDFSYPGPRLLYAVQTVDGMRLSCDLQPLFGDGVQRAVRTLQLSVHQRGLSLTVTDDWALEAADALQLNYVTPGRWLAEASGARCNVEGVQLALSWREASAVPVTAEVDHTMIDSCLQPLDTLRLTTAPGRRFWIETSIVVQW